MKLTILFLIIILSINALEGIERDDGFNKFIDIFPLKSEQATNSKCLNSIPLTLLNQYTNNLFVSDKSISSACAIFRIEKEESILVVYQVNCSAGGYCAYYYYNLYSLNGELIETTKITFDYGDEESSKVTIINNYDDLLECKIFEETSDTDTVYYQYYYFSGNVLNEINSTCDENRDFSLTSYRIIKKEEITTHTKNQLDIMRNEIFADHGYIFKTQKWKDYFADKPWYIPRYDDVNDKLSVIEKINIQTILEVSKNK
jgi:hypothetical protein